jgi:ketosteroid isomerase-like protein
MTAGSGSASAAVMERLAAAMNAHDIEAHVACFAEDYRSEQPVHPDRGFGGRDQVRANWSAIFAGIPDFEAELIRTAAEGDTVWSEWRWRGNRDAGSPLDMAGVIICGVRDGLIAWGRLYVEDVERGGAGIDAAVRRMATGETD